MMPMYSMYRKLLNDMEFEPFLTVAISSSLSSVTFGFSFDAFNQVIGFTGVSSVSECFAADLCSASRRQYF